MKRLLPLLVILAGCSSGPSIINARTDVVGIDLRPYTEQGFLFTPNAYAGEHDAVGIITVTVWPKALKVQRSSGATLSEWQQEPVNVADALQQARDQAAELGADALTNVVITQPTRQAWGAVLSGVEISGFAIRRKQ